MATQARELETQREKIAEFTNPLGVTKKGSNSDEARRLQLAFASTKGESLQTEEDRILSIVIRKITTDIANASKTREGVNNIRGRQDNKEANGNGDKSDGSRSTSRDRERNRRQHVQAKKSSVPLDSLISSLQELEDQEQDRLNGLAAERVLQAATSV